MSPQEQLKKAKTELTSINQRISDFKKNGGLVPVDLIHLRNDYRNIVKNLNRKSNG